MALLQAYIHTKLLLQDNMRSYGMRTQPDLQTHAPLIHPKPGNLAVLYCISPVKISWGTKSSITDLLHRYMHETFYTYTSASKTLTVIEVRSVFVK